MPKTPDPIRQRKTRAGRLANGKREVKSWLAAKDHDRLRRLAERKMATQSEVIAEALQTLENFELKS